MSEQIQYFFCDPRKHTTCRKTACFLRAGSCSATTNPEYAFRDEDGKPFKYLSLTERLKMIRKSEEPPHD